MQAGDLFVIIVMISICSSGRSDPDQHLRPCDVAQHQVQQRGKLQEVLRLRHRPPQVCFKLSEILTTDHRFFSMSSLHIWFSKLKWSLDVLLRFYERHAFICALHKVSNISSLAFLLGGTLAHLVFFLKETKLLFDELNFCLQRLYSIPFHVDMPFNDSILEEITTAEASPSSQVALFQPLAFPSLSIGILIPKPF